MYVALCNSVFNMPISSATRQSAGQYKPNNGSGGDSIDDFLRALHQIGKPGAMAHVSVVHRDGKYVPADGKKIRLQITTKPKEQDEKGLPLVWSEEEGSRVALLWARDFLTDELMLGNVSDRVAHWERIFIEELEKAKNAIREEYRRAGIRFRALRNV